MRAPTSETQAETIADSARLAAVCAELAREPFVAVDTEFLRDKTYWSRLCLVQIASAGGVYVIDPLAAGIDLAPMYALMHDPAVVKVFHAARQDVEIILQASGAPPKPLFDTQIAAMACGFGDSVAYADLVRALLHKQVDKSQRLTDWSRRPLAKEQILYAAREVEYLRAVYRALNAKLAAAGREEWVRAEMEAVADPEPYLASRDPELAWKRLKRPPRAGPETAAALRAVAAWREREAQTRDVPRLRVMRDEALYEIVATAPKSLEELADRRITKGTFHRTDAAKRLLAALADARAADAPPAPRAQALPTRAPTATREALRLALKAASERHKVAPPLIATAAELDAIAAGARKARCLQGWRREVFGDDALALLEGRASLALEDGGARLVVRRDGAPSME